MEYSGTEILETMTLAKNYNSYLTGLITKYSESQKSILDFGAGLGIYAEALREDNFDVACFEIDTKLVAGLRAKNFEVISNANAVSPNTFHTIYSLNVLEHIEKDEEVLSDFYRWLKPKGRILICVPAFMHLYSALDKSIGHFRRYTRPELLEKIEHAGFCIQKCHYVDSIGYFASILFKCIGNREGHVSRSSIKIYDRFIFPLSLGMDRAVCHSFGKNIFLVAEKS